MAAYSLPDPGTPQSLCKVISVLHPLAAGSSETGLQTKIQGSFAHKELQTAWA